MLVVKAKHGRRQYKYGGRGIINNILNSPLAQKLAVAAVAGAAKGIAQSALRKRQQEQQRQEEVSPKNLKRQADQVINGSGIVLD